MKTSDLSIEEYPSYHGRYIKSLPDKEFLELLQDGCEEFLALAESISKEKGDYRYGEGKWTVKEVLLHLMDTERIFVYRALRFARNDFTQVPGFEQDDYAPESLALDRNVESIISEYKTLRYSTIEFFRNLPEQSILRFEPKDRSKLSVRAVAFFIAGHEKHHLQILRDRYLD